MHNPFYNFILFNIKYKSDIKNVHESFIEDICYEKFIMK